MRYLQRGLTTYDRKQARPGFTVFSPQNLPKTYVINMAGDVVHEWSHPERTGAYGYLLENGNLLVSVFAGGGPEGFAARGGLIRELDWHGKVLWEYRDEFQHHDFRRCANGNTIYLGWELLPPEVARRVKGGRPGTERKEGVWGDYVREVDAAGKTVWEWHGRDHLDPDEHPLTPFCTRHEFAHPNTIVPMADGNVMICFRHIDLLAIIDRRTGALTWRHQDSDLGGPHDFQMLPNGNFMVFANRQAQVPRGSKILEFDPATRKAVWEYWGNPTHTFDSHFISGCQRLDNGNTLICEGLWGRLFEVTPAGDVVWEYISPYTAYRAVGPTTGDQSTVFRAYRYAADSPQIRGRLDGKLGD